MNNMKKRKWKSSKFFHLFSECVCLLSRSVYNVSVLSLALHRLASATFSMF